jgi:hypothetical protein
MCVRKCDCTAATLHCHVTPLMHETPHLGPSGASRGRSGSDGNLASHHDSDDVLLASPRLGRAQHFHADCHARRPLHARNMGGHTHDTNHSSPNHSGHPAGCHAPLISFCQPRFSLCDVQAAAVVAAAAAAACAAAGASAQSPPPPLSEWCGGSFTIAPGADSQAEQSLDLLRFGPPLGNVSGYGNGSNLRSITLSIPSGSTGMGGQQFFAYGKAGGECGMPGDRAESNGYSLFPINCDTSGACMGAVPTELAAVMECPVPPGAQAVVFAILGAPASRSAEVM